MHHSQQTGGFFASAVLLLASFDGFSIIFWRLATFTHFMGVATLYVAT
jgi:hypothetical protein